MRRTKESGWRRLLENTSKNLHEWISSYIHPKAVMPLVILAVIFIGLLTFMIRDAVITGFVLGPGGEVFFEELNMNFSGMQEYVWYPENEGLISSIRLDGIVKGNGTARVSIVAGNETYLMLDSQLLDDQAGGVITGFVTGITQDAEIESIILDQPTEEKVNENKEKVLKRGDKKKDKDDKKKDKDNDEKDKEKDKEDDERDKDKHSIPPEDANIMISLEYITGTEFDSDDDGIEMYDGVIDFKVNETEFSWDVDKAYLCTKWKIENLDNGSEIEICNGDERCCNFIEVIRDNDKWDADYYAFIGKDEIGENNSISAQVLYVDYNLSSENLYSYIYYSDKVVKDAIFIPGSALRINFTDTCIDTCILPGINFTNYKIIIETEPGTSLWLGNISYNIISDAVPIQNVTIDISVKDAYGDEAPVDIEIYDSLTGEKLIEHKTDKISKKVKEILPIEEQMRNNLKVKKGQRDIIIKPRGELRSVIKYMNINKVELNADSSEFIRIDDVSDEIIIDNVKRVYAIDPTQLDFNNATVTVSASKDAKWLYKCASWNFTTMECPVLKECSGTTKDTRVCNVTGGWQKLKRLISGEDYNITLTPNDPGFAEYDISFTAPYCSTGESPCVANSSLLQSVDNAGGTSEPNQPNTIDNCTDGTSGTYLTDESVENITVTSLNHSVFRVGDIINIKATVNCFDGSRDNINFVYTNNSEIPAWKVIGSVDSCPATGMNEVEINYTLDNVTGNHTVRLIIQYNGNVTDTCGAGGYDDNDDVVFKVNDFYPLSNHPIDQNVSLGEESVIEWILVDDVGPGDYYVLRNNETFLGPIRWENNTKIIVRPNNNFIGRWNYTIYYNNSQGIVGISDNVVVDVHERILPSCANLSIEGEERQPYPLLTTIIIDGEMSDWDAVLTNSENYISDLSVPAGDNDSVNTVDRDLIGGAYTWDSQYVYFYLYRLTSGKNVINMLVYLDYDNDGYMNASDKVARFAWSGSNRQYNSDIYNYIPAGTADIIYGSGYDMPGSVSINKSLESKILGGAESGIELETRVLWSDLGLSESKPIHFRFASALGVNLPSQLEDNIDSLISQHSFIVFYPDLTKAASSNSSVYFAHDLQNCGMIDEVINFTSFSSEGFNVTLYHPNGSLIPDMDNDTAPDLMLSKDNYTTVIAKLDIPASVSSGTIDYTTITAISLIGDVSDNVTDETIIGDLIITPVSKAVSGTSGMLASYEYTIYNLQSFSDTIELEALSSENWQTGLYYTNGTALFDTDGDNDSDVGILQQGESIDIIVNLWIPSDLKKSPIDITIITATSSNNITVSSTATVTTAVKKRITIEPDYSRSVGIGDSTYYKLIISNNWNDSDIIDIDYSYNLGWTTELYDSDLVTPLTDSDNDGLVDVNMSDGYGLQYNFYFKIHVPSTAIDGSREMTTVYANSSLVTTESDTNTIEAIAKVVVTYSNAVRNNQATIFNMGDLVYARAHNLEANNVYFMWITPNSTVLRTSTDIAVSSKKEADDEYSVPLLGPPGTWTLIVFDSQNDLEIGRTMFDIRELTPPNVTLDYPSNGSTNPIGDITFNCSATDNYGLMNISLYLTDVNNQSFMLNSSVNISGTDNSSLWMLELDQGNYTWNCIAYDAWGNLDWGENWTLIVTNASIAPSKVISYSPINDTSDPELRLTFIWYNATDSDGDTLTYQIQVDDYSDFSSSLEVNVTGIAEGSNLTNYTLLSDLATDTQYYWRVRACDADGCGLWSDVWEYYAEGMISFRFVNQNVSFGMMEQKQENDTTDGLPMPFIIENDGNVMIDIIINASSTLWFTQLLDTLYFRFLADDRDEFGSFNLTGSQNTWMNVSLQNKLVIRQLKSDNASDTAVIDLSMRVPDEEPAGAKTTNINLKAIKSI